MKKLLFMLLCFMFLCSCALSGKGIAKSPSNVDWEKTSTYYHTFMSTLAPIGLAVARVSAPDSADAITMAQKELKNLDDLIEARAAHKSLKDQAGILYKAVKDANFKVGSNLFKLLK